MKNRQIDAAITLMADRRRAFSAKDVAVFEEWEGLEDSIDEALRRQCQNGSIIPLDSANDEDSYPRYLSTEAARNWWVESTLRWVPTDIDCVTSAQLAKRMSFALDIGRTWETPPKSLLNVAREWALVAEGCLPDTFVFPWVTFMRWDNRFRRLFPLFFKSKADISWSDFTLESEIYQALSTLRDREARIIRLRFGLDGARKYTLEEVGREFGVTRERIRQIEAKALRKLRHPKQSRGLLLGLASDFVRSGGSLLLFDSQKRPVHLLVCAVFGDTSEYIPELGVSVILDADTSEFRQYLNDDDALEFDSQKLAEILPFLSKADAYRLRKPIETHKQNLVASWSRPRMILQALRSLGRAAHFREIGQRCNEMFPDKANTIHNWHAAMDRSERYGIVWIGRKGMYGLKEHGYSRPNKDLFDSAADIVERKYSETRQPVTDEVVIEELGKVRRELNPNSVTMALSFSERLKSLGGGRFVPKGAPINGSEKDNSPRYDISAAFEAFAGEEDS